MSCLLVQPIADAGISLLERNGVSVVRASSHDMETVSREIADARAVITRDAGLSREAMEAAPNLLVVGNHGVGVDPVDLDYATEHGIVVVNSPNANSVAVAEHAISLMLAVNRRLNDADDAARNRDFGFKYRVPMRELSRKRVGIVGYGAIGMLTASMLSRGFMAEVLVYRRSGDLEAVRADGFTPCESLRELVERSDIVSFHVPLTEETQGLVSREVLEWFRPDSVLINTSRAGIIDEPALAEALERGKIAGAGLDVFSLETAGKNVTILDAPNTVITPHIGGSTKEALERTAVAVCRQVLDALNGRRPDHIVNPAAWDRRRGEGSD